MSKSKKPAESRFSVMFDKLNEPSLPTVESPVPPETPEQEPLKPLPEVVEKRGRGRPRGKRSSTDFEATTVYLDRKLKKEIQKRLLDKEIRDGERALSDLSEVINLLVSSWLKHGSVEDAMEASIQLGIALGGINHSKIPKF